MFAGMAAGSSLPPTAGDRLRNLLSPGLDVIWTKSLAQVLCPTSCGPDKASRVIGTSIHPKQSAVCASALADGIVPSAGGKLILRAIEGLHTYTGSPLIAGQLAAEDGADIAGEAMIMYAQDSIDQIEGNVRLVDEDGYLAAEGRVELRTDKGWGTVCGLNQAAADKLCQEMG